VACKARAYERAEKAGRPPLKTASPLPKRQIYSLGSSFEKDVERRRLPAAAIGEADAEPVVNVS
jgi:hypothetical protein